MSRETDTKIKRMREIELQRERASVKELTLKE